MILNLLEQSKSAYEKECREEGERRKDFLAAVLAGWELEFDRNTLELPYPLGENRFLVVRRRNGEGKYWAEMAYRCPECLYLASIQIYPQGIMKLEKLSDIYRWFEDALLFKKCLCEVRR